MSESSAAAEPKTGKVSKKGIWGWMLFDWAAQPFHTSILTFIFAPYFTAHVAPDAVTGQAQLVAGLAEVEIRHGTDEADQLARARHLEVARRAICFEIMPGLQLAEFRLDHFLRHAR